MRLTASLLCPCLALAALVPGQEPLKAAKIVTPPTIDGVVGDEEWKDVPFREGLHDAATGATYPDGGRFWLAYDKDFVYFAARLQESDPRAIRATEYRTNVSLTGDDYVELDLDLSGSMSAFNIFQINPQGATNILIAGGRAAKREWLGAIVAKARVTGTGWEAEAKIPWQAMTIPAGGRRNLRFNFARFVARTQRNLSYVYVPLTQTALTPTWQGVELPRPAVDRSIKLLPYTYAGYDADKGQVWNAGVDMKTALTEQVNLVGSVNPDFRNIENQILSIDFSRFERLAGETRPFFQEGRQYSNSALFASQRIRTFDVGLNTYGRLSDTTSFSLINTTRFGKENDVIFNLTHDPTPNDSIRVTASNLDREGLTNTGYLVRYSKNMGDYNVFLRDMGTQDSLLGFGRQSDALLSYGRAGLSVGGGYTRAEKDFRPRLGFVPEVDLQGPFVQFDYLRPYEHGTISNWEFTGFGLSYDRLTGDFYRNEYGATLSTQIRPGLGVSAACDLGDFEGSKDSLYTLAAAFPHGNPYKNVGVRFDTGRQAGIDYRSLTLTSAYRLSNKLQLTLRHQSIDYGGRSDQTIGSLLYDLGRDRSISGRVVTQDGNTNAYLAFRRSGNEGIEYFLILGDPNAPSYRNSLILKVVVPLSIGKHGLDASSIRNVIR